MNNDFKLEPGDIIRTESNANQWLWIAPNKWLMNFSWDYACVDESDDMNLIKRAGFIVERNGEKVYPVPVVEQEFHKMANGEYLQPGDVVRSKFGNPGWVVIGPGHWVNLMTGRFDNGIDVPTYWSVTRQEKVIQEAKNEF